MNYSRIFMNYSWSRKQGRTNFGKISRFLKKKKFADSLWHGSLALYMPKPDKNDASNGLIIAKVQQFFPGRFRAWIALEN